MWKMGVDWGIVHGWKTEKIFLPRAIKLNKELVENEKKRIHRDAHVPHFIRYEEMVHKRSKEM